MYSDIAMLSALLMITRERNSRFASNAMDLLDQFN